MADDNRVNIVVVADDQASKTLKAIGSVFSDMSGLTRDLTGELGSYGAEIKQLATYTGLTSAETSKLYQVADDAGIKFETLSQAAKALTMDNMATAKETAKLTEEIKKVQAQMAKKPSEELRAKLVDLQAQLKAVGPSANLSIDTLARLSDEFVKIKDPVQQAIFLQENFKRSGEDLAKMMVLGGDKIRAMSKNVSDSLIIDDAKAARIEKTRVALDDFNDRLTGMRYDVADTLLGIFTSMPAPLQDATLALGSFLSPTNINSMIEFGLLVKGMDFGKLAIGIKASAVAAWQFAAPIIATVAPILAVVAAVFALIKLFEMDEFKKGAALLWGGIGTMVTGDSRRGAAATQAAYGALGGGAPGSMDTGNAIRSALGVSAAGQPQGSVVNFNYSPAISTASQYEAQQQLKPMIEQILRQGNGR